MRESTPLEEPMKQNHRIKLRKKKMENQNMNRTAFLSYAALRQVQQTDIAEENKELRIKMT